MREPVSGINPKLLIWARHRCGQSIAEVAQALGKQPEVIESWESGASAPTYAQLEALAYRIYKRPLALFFFPEPPDEPDPEHSFRTLPDFEIQELGPDTRFHIRDARALQLGLYELNGGRNPASRRIFRDLRLSRSLPPAETADQVRSYLGIDLETQTKEWRRPEDALKAWRSAIEEVGVFVFKESLRQRDVSGFCLYDEEFPIIYLNNSTTVTRQIFTLFHELAHILSRTGGVTKLDDRYIGALSGEAKRIEVFCNRFAAELLVPVADFCRRIQGLSFSDETVATLAGEYKVSREVILRRLRDLDLVSQSDYEQRASLWRREHEERTRGQGGGNYYATKVAYLGESYLRLAFSRYYQGAISIQQLADFLSVRVSSVHGLEQLVLQKAAV
jgi:Zn-dependent peptidase ImmA (M78 family)